MVSERQGRFFVAVKVEMQVGVLVLLEGLFANLAGLCQAGPDCGVGGRWQLPFGALRSPPENVTLGEILTTGCFSKHCRLLLRPVSEKPGATCV